jgi:nitroreductase
VRYAAVRATRAPSVHNTQPWRLVIRGAALEVHADGSRQLRVLDPRGRQMLISVGCAVFNARVGLAAAGVRARLEWLPDSLRPDFVARLVPTRDAGPGSVGDVRIAHLEPAIDIRQTNRRRFTDESVPARLVDTLIGAAAAEGGRLVPIVRPAHRLATARLSQLADQYENADPAYRAELRVWTTDDPRRADGVPAFAVPHVDGHGDDDIPIRDFDTTGMGWLPSQSHSSLDQCLLLLGTRSDDATAWLHAGCALERVLLEVALAGYTASPLTQVIEVAHTNALLRAELGLDMAPHVLLRVGRAPVTPATRRRRLVDVLTEAP